MLNAIRDTGELSDETEAELRKAVETFSRELPADRGRDRRLSPV